MKSVENKYYNYIYLDPRKPGKYTYKNFSFLYEPFYVGKGINFRAYNKGGHIHNIAVVRKLNKLIKEGYIMNFIVIKIIENITSYFALKRETKLIRMIGRKDLNKGPLLNLTDGGDDPPNQKGKHWKLSKEYILKRKREWPASRLENARKYITREIREKQRQTILKRHPFDKNTFEQFLIKCKYRKDIIKMMNLSYSILEHRLLYHYNTTNFKKLRKDILSR